MSPNEPTFVIGLDFGTTMTSVSYYKFNSQDRPATVARNAIKSITNWPHSGRDQSKGEVPSEGLYLEGEYFWGYEARPKLKHAQCSGESLNASNRLIRFAKLILEKPGLELDDTDAIREMKETIRNLGKSVKDVITDYLVVAIPKNIWRIMKTFGKQAQWNFLFLFPPDGVCVPPGPCKR
jgi:hypothetical protein